jgi:hypothetical protein
MAFHVMMFLSSFSLVHVMKLEYGGHTHRRPDRHHLAHDSHLLPQQV